MALFVIFFHLFWIFPDCLPARKVPIQNKAQLRMFSANLLMINPQKMGIIKEIRQANADVLLLQEYSPQWHKALEDAGILDHFSEQIFRLRTDSFGIALFSKYKCIHKEIWRVENIPMIKVHIDFAGKIICIYNIHTLPRAFPNTLKFGMRKQKSFAMKLPHKLCLWF